jgi:hypothetical protein
MTRARRLPALIAVPMLALVARAGADWAPPLPRDTTIVTAMVRPYVHLAGPGGGVLAHARVAHYFQSPFVVFAEVAPAAFVVESSDTGALTHARLHAAYADDLIEIGVGAGGRLQRFGPSGLSFAGTLRLGALDGVHAQLEYVYSLVDNYYTRRRSLSLAAVSGSVSVPLGARVWLQLDGGVGFDAFAYGTASLRHRLRGDGGRGTLDIVAGGGFAWVVDRFPCQYQDPTPCTGAAGALGPTLALGIDWRF